MSSLKQALAEQKRVSEEAQASGQAAEQQAQEVHSLTEQLEQLCSASQAKDTELSSVRVRLGMPPAFLTLFSTHTVHSHAGLPMGGTPTLLPTGAVCPFSQKQTIRK